MKLKNLFLLLAAATTFAACSSSDEVIEEKKQPDTSWLKGAPGTEVYTGVDVLKNYKKLNATRSGVEVNALAHTADAPYIDIKVDPRLGYDIDPSTYYSTKRKGAVYTDCPFITYETTPQVRKYMLSTNGTGLRTLIAAGDTTTATVKEALESKRTKTVSPYVREENIHVIWYFAKDMENGWHINGLLTDKEDLKSACDASRDEGFGEITFDENNGKSQLTYSELIASYNTIFNIKPIDKALGIDIHQQQHIDWGQIKTSVHIKEAKTVTITLPITMDYSVESTNVNEVVKYFGGLYEVQEFARTAGASINVSVARNRYDVTITITGITDEFINALERRYNDCLTIEINTFYRFKDAEGNTTQDAVWNQLKNATVQYDGNITGQVTSAYNREYVKLDK